MARPKALVPGNCYFHVNFYDNDLLLPDVQTLVYVRSEVDEERGRYWLFRELALPREPADETGSGGDEVFVAFGGEQLYRILDFPGLIRDLGEVAVDHPIHPAASSDDAATPAAAPDELSNQVSAFLSSPEYVALGVTIRFTDDGLSIKRHESGHFRMGFSLRPRLEPEREAAVRALFAGESPEEDYLYNAGRGRVLTFPIPNDLDGIVALCRRVLAEVYAMQADDSIKYTPISLAQVLRLRAEG